MAKQTFAGFEQDVTAIRGVRLSMEQKVKGAEPEWSLLAADEVTGDLSDGTKIIAALKQLKEKLGMAASDRVSVCLSGKQTYAVEMDVKKLPDSDMPGMLKLELRKTMPFEAVMSTFNYQFLSAGSNQPKDADVPLLVSAAANALLNKVVHSYDKAGMPPYHVDILPISIANAFWAAQPGGEASNEAHVMLHFGCDVCTLVIDGDTNPFFNRTFAFNIDELIASSGAVKKAGDALSDLDLQMNVLASEVTKSISYYRNTNRGANVTKITVMGNHASHPMFKTLGEKIGYEMQPVQTAKLFQTAASPEPGKYDVAMALAMQAA